MSLKILLEPRVYLVGGQWCLGGLEDYLRDEGFPEFSSDANSGSEKLAEVSGRICYGKSSFQNPRPGGNKAYLENILSKGHGRVLEHSVYSLILADVSRACTHELYTHTAGFSKTMRSTRYVDESEAGFVLPEDLRPAYLSTLDKARVEDIKAKREFEDPFYSWLQSCENSLLTYRQLVQQVGDRLEREGKSSGTELRKRVRQASRSVLPQCVATQVFVTLNARSARNFFESRASVQADPEIRRLSGQIYLALLGVSPHLFSDYKKEDLPDGTFTLSTPYRKV